MGNPLVLAWWNSRTALSGTSRDTPVTVKYQQADIRNRLMSTLVSAWFALVERWYICLVHGVWKVVFSWSNTLQRWSLHGFCWIRGDLCWLKAGSCMVHNGWELALCSCRLRAGPYMAHGSWDSCLHSSWWFRLIPAWFMIVGARLWLVMVLRASPCMVHGGVELMPACLLMVASWSLPGL